MVKTGVQVRELLLKDGETPTLVNARFVKPLDEKLLSRLAQKHKLFVTMEENVATGGFGSQVADYMRRMHPEVRVLTIALPDSFIEHGNPEKLKEKAGIDGVSVYRKIKEAKK